MSASSAADERRARAALARAGSFCFIARGASMRPAVRDGDRLTVVPLLRPARPGEILYLRSGIAHRVLRVRGCSALTKGDALPLNDGWSPPRELLGRVSQVQRGGRRVAHRAWVAVPISIATGWLRRLAAQLRSQR